VLEVSRGTVKCFWRFKGDIDGCINGLVVEQGFIFKRLEQYII